ncbi:MAG TPA: hypothetical protein DF613_00580 [Lachnospiraceae bacterium]|nr:hypothetical protein [Lachnospiraceae bacterium]
MISKLFSTPKRTAVTMGSLFLLLVAIGVGTVVAAKSVTKNSSIGEENAKNFAFADAGVDPLLAKRVRTEYGHEQGHFVYEVEFVADNMEYEYWIKAEDGSVVKKQTELLDVSGSDITTAEKIEGESQAVSAQGAGNGNRDIPEDSSGTVTQDEQTDLSNGGSDTGSYIGIDRAKAIAVEHAGFTDNEVSFSKAKLENDDGYTLYEIEFYKDRMEYEYKIHASTGEILEYDMDRDD